ncbi:uncharacterized protein LOC124940054 [Impatiens glandulifera]|uniref:uncharacterized protein LOC124940054 n=1 Tax=Impatiens glandulifera TaxID=253017 RepID=UPI001FB04DB2|nr:uncharacterized protein LOC124940054 [Impatiens glandulifera]
MEKLMMINGYDKEYMKMAMLKHEETFKQQVHELHRLYQIQKGLMKDINIIDPIHDHIEESIDETQLDLTLGPTSFNREKKHLDQTPSFSSSNSSTTRSSNSKRELREGSRNGKKWDQGDKFIDKGFKRSGNNISFDEEGKLNRQKDGMPSWLYGGMSLKMS